MSRLLGWLLLVSAGTVPLAATTGAHLAAQVQDAPPAPVLPAPFDEAEWRVRVLQKAVEVLQDRAPAPWPTSLVVGVPPWPVPVRGLTQAYEDGTVVVYVRPVDSVEEMMDVLIHEWAHAMLTGLEQQDSHDEHWGLAFSRAYRAVMGAAQMGAFDALVQELQSAR